MKKPLTIHTGLLHPELERAFVAELKAIKQTDPLEPVVVLVGSNLLRDYLGFRLIETGLNLFNIRFLTISDLARDLSLLENVADSRSDLPADGQLGAVIVAAEALTGTGYFQKILNRTGFMRALTQTFIDLDEALIDTIEDAARLDRTGKLKSVSELRHKYIGLIKGFRSYLDDLLPVPEFRKRFAQTYQTETLFIYGLYDFNAAQWRFLSSLSGEIKFRVFLPYQPGDDFGGAFRYAETALDLFRELQKNTPPGSRGGNTRGGLAPVNEEKTGYGHHLFRFKPDEKTAGYIPSDRRLSVFTSPDTASEVKGIVSRINELALWKDVPLHRIGVLLYHPEHYLEPLRYELEHAGIPYVDTIGTALGQSPEGRTFYALLCLAGRILPHKQLVDLIASSDMKLVDAGDPEPTTQPDTAAWETISVETGILEGDLKQWMNRLDQLEKNLDHDDPGRRRKSHLINQDQINSFRMFIERLFKSWGNLPDKATWTQFSDGAVQLALDFLPENDTTSLLSETVRELRRLDELTGRIERERFVAAAGQNLDAVRLKRGRYGRDGITICDRMSSRGVSFDQLFIPGLAQGMVPAAPREDPILSDMERRDINKQFSGSDHSSAHKLLLPLPLKSARLEEERLLFALAVDAAGKGLVLSYPGRGTGGKECIPSRFLLEVCRIASGKLVDSEQLDKLDFFENDADPTKHEKLTSRAIDAASFPLQWVSANVGSTGSEEAYRELFEGRSERCRRCREVSRHRTAGDRFTAWDGVMPPRWSARSSIDDRYSVTSLERYSDCPFKYFILDVLKVAEWEEPEMLLEPLPMTIGQVVHSILENFYTHAQNEERIPLDEGDMDWSKTIIATLVTDELKRVEAHYPIPRPIWELVARRLKKRLLRFIAEDAARADRFPFHEAEVEIDRTVTFETGEGPYNMHLTGKVDRIDMTGDGKAIRVIDYKTGQVHAGADRFDGGRALQLPIYLKAMLEQYPDLEPLKCSAEYLKIDLQGRLKSVPFGGRILMERSEELGQLVRIVTESIGAGLFPPLGVGQTCRNCDARFLCDIRSRKAVEYRKVDPRIGALLTAREYL